MAGSAAASPGAPLPAGPPLHPPNVATGVRGTRPAPATVTAGARTRHRPVPAPGTVPGSLGSPSSRGRRGMASTTSPGIRRSRAGSCSRAVAVAAGAGPAAPSSSPDSPEWQAAAGEAGGGETAAAGGAASLHSTPPADRQPPADRAAPGTSRRCETGQAAGSASAADPSWPQEPGSGPEGRDTGRRRWRAADRAVPPSLAPPRTAQPSVT